MLIVLSGMGKTAQRIHPTSPSEFRRWLRDYHAKSDGVWVVFHKKSTGLPRMSYDESVEVALCFGWIDSRPSKLDSTRSMLWFTPRRPGSGWSRKNKERLRHLQARGLMHPAGRAKVAAAKADGSWTQLDQVERLIVPDDLAKALQAKPGAKSQFDGFPPSSQKTFSSGSPRRRNPARERCESKRLRAWRKWVEGPTIGILSFLPCRRVACSSAWHDCVG